MSNAKSVDDVFADLCDVADKLVDYSAARGETECLDAGQRLMLDEAFSRVDQVLTELSSQMCEGLVDDDDRVGVDDDSDFHATEGVA